MRVPDGQTAGGKAVLRPALIRFDLGAQIILFLLLLLYEDRGRCSLGRPFTRWPVGRSAPLMTEEEAEAANAIAL